MPGGLKSPNTWLGSTLSNYALLGLRIGSMLLLTRSLYLGLDAQSYGFWGLLWSVFSYTLLLDFGFGTAVQKWTSQAAATGDWRAFGKLYSSLLTSYGLMGLLLALASLPMAAALPRWFHFQGDPSPFQQIFLLFGLGSGLIFPTGIGAEMLRGLGRIQDRNRLQAIGLLLQTLGSLLLLSYWPNLLALTGWTLGTTFLLNLAMLRQARQNLPAGFRPGRPSLALLREVAGFSLSAWLITLTNLLIFRSDQVVIGTTLGVAAIANYQIAGRLADLFRQLTTQLHDYLGPLAAGADARGDRALLQRTLLDTERWVGLLAVCIGLPLAWRLPDLLALWLHTSEPTLLLCARILLASMFIQVSLRSSSTQILLMCRRERALMWGGLLEAGLNLGLSLLLASRLGLVGVALGTLIPNLLMALVFQLPLASRLCTLRPAVYLTRVGSRVWLTAAVAGLLAWPLEAGLAGWTPLARLLAGGPSMLLLSLGLALWLGLTAEEKSRLSARVQKKRDRAPRGQWRQSRV